MRSAWLFLNLKDNIRSIRSNNCANLCIFYEVTKQGVFLREIVVFIIEGTAGS
jgi:hypothetical protein